MTNRREFLKGAAYTAPVILTLNARPAFAGNGSKRPHTGGQTYSHEDIQGYWQRLLAWWQGRQ